MKQTQRVEVPRTGKLVQTLATSIRAVAPRVIIESGTYLGTGSTRLILEALGDIRPDAFYTIEVSPSLVERARANLAAFPWVQVVWGLSVTRREAISFIESDPLLRDLDPKLDIFVDFLPDPRSGYANEIRCGIGNGDGQAAPRGGPGVASQTGGTVSWPWGRSRRTARAPCSSPHQAPSRPAAHQPRFGGWNRVAGVSDRTRDDGGSAFSFVFGRH
jgi:hypothetical protein